MPSKERKKKKKELKTYGKTAKLGALWVIAKNGVRYLLLIPITAIMARLLSPTEFGIAAAAGFFLTMAARVTELGLNASLVRVKVLRPDHGSTVFVTAMAGGTTAWLTLTLAAPYLGAFFRSPEVGAVLPVAALAFLITPLSTVPSAILERNFRYKANSIADWADSLTGGIVSIVLAWMGFSYWSVIYAHLASTSINVALKLYFTGWVPSFKFSRQAMSELWSFGMGIQAKRLLQFGAQNLDNLLVGRLIGITALGFYDKAFNTTFRLGKLVSLGAGVSFRIFTIIQDDDARFRQAYRKTLLTICIISLPVVAACIAVAPQLFEVLYGERWLPAVPAFQILCLGSMVRLLSAHASQANEAKGRIWQQVTNHVVYVTLIALGVWIGSRWGIAGAAAGVMTARIVLAVLIQDLLRRSMNGTWADMLQPALPGAISAGAVAAIVLLTEVAVRAVQPSVSAWQLLLVQTVVGALPYIALMVFSPFPRVREVMQETVEDFMPALARRIYPPPPEPIVKVS